MHSSGLRGKDFTLTLRTERLSHAEFFADHTPRTRVGIVAPVGTDGVAAITFLMAAVTAFYDRYRDVGDEFFAYPDFFSFQRESPLTDYGFLELWPNKDVLIPNDHNQTLAAINDRGINVLLVPDVAPRELEYDAVHQEGARRNLERCFLYGSGDLAIRCELEPLRTYAQRMLNAAGSGEVPDWSEEIVQSFRQLDVAEALARL